MAVRRKPAPKSTSLALDKIIRSRKNLSEPPPRLWLNCEDEGMDLDERGSPVLKLTHPILCTLDSCTGIKEFNKVHAQLMVSGLFQHPLAAGRAIKRLCSDSRIPHAIHIFDYLDEPDAFQCNTIMRSYTNMNDFRSALSFYYEKMVTRWVNPNHYTFPLLMKICAEVRSVREGEKSHARIVKFGFELDLFTRNSLIHMYSVCGRIGDARLLFDSGSVLDLVSYNSMIDGYVNNKDIGAARKLFDEMSERDVFSWNSMIAGYVGIGDLEAAQDLFDRMPKKDVVSWNSMIDGYAKTGNVSLAREFFDRMPVRNVVSWNSIMALYVRFKNFSECLRLADRMMERGEALPNEATLVSVLTACANLGRLDTGFWVHSYIKSKGIKPDVLLSTSLLTMYAKCGAVDMAKDVFDEMPIKSVVSWNSMIIGYGLHGDGEKALELFMEMEKKGPQPNEATFVCILSACTHAGMVMEGWWYFDLMRRVYKMEPNVEHYGCMVDLLARAGLMRNSEELIRKIPIKSEGGSALWGALLSACRTHLDSELGKIVAKRLIELKPQDIGPYILLSNIYAAEGKWDDVEQVRLVIKEKGLQKQSASSLVHLEDFESKNILGNNSVSRKRIVYSMLNELGTQMKLSLGDWIEK
ncbi:pentatricopeptide repeat-containing protein At3g29230-like [Prosopis cineraria]|uniref:pentatricopeptide repeat-containing protein At3g29230-like n=1 Tax=Prosopis cineraria TaxID=364024 RepID=UPI00240FA5F7|nr:pentatricopeptide repeat-containing protein At3g29230-like [Prosopis cineraria]